MSTATRIRHRHDDSLPLSSFRGNQKQFLSCFVDAEVVVNANGKKLWEKDDEMMHAMIGVLMAYFLDLFCFFDSRHTQ